MSSSSCFNAKYRYFLTCSFPSLNSSLDRRMIFSFLFLHWKKTIFSQKCTIDLCHEFWSHVVHILVNQGCLVSHDCCMFQGLKTGMYYLRTKPAASAIQFTVDKTKLAQPSGKSAAEQKVEETTQNMAAMVCSLQNKEDCMMCGS